MNIACHFRRPARLACLAAVVAGVAVVSACQPLAVGVWA